MDLNYVLFNGYATTLTRHNRTNTLFELFFFLQAGEQLDLPGKQKIAELPDIEWEKYRVVAADEVVRPSRPDTRYASAAASSSTNPSSTRVVDGQVQTLLFNFQVYSEAPSFNTIMI